MTIERPPRATSNGATPAGRGGRPAGARAEVARAVVVLGMGRSGTSLVARILNLLGVDLGAEDGLLPARQDNLRGYWEQAPLLLLNDRVLAALGGTWDAPPALPDGWERAPALDPLADEARATLRRLFGESRLWGFKDPRTSLTLPFWRQLLPRPSYVLCLRNPAEVAASLHARDGHAPERSLALWFQYTVAALRNASGAPRAIVSYEDLLEEPDRQIRLIAAAAGVEGDISPATRAGIDAFLEATLRHQRVPGPATARDGSIPPEARLLYGLALSRARAQAAGPAFVAEPGELDDMLDVLALELWWSWADRTTRAVELDRARRALATLTESRSWRLTAPLRAAARLRSQGRRR